MKKWIKPELPDFTHDAHGDEIQLIDNSFRPKGVDLPLTAEHLKELKRCAENPLYFADNYLKVLHPDKGRVTLKLRDYQKRLFAHIHNNRNSCNLLPRQVGKTTISSAYLIWYMIFNPDKLIGVLAHKLMSAEEILFKTKIMYQSLPIWMQQGVEQFSKRRVVLENKTRAIAESTSGGAAAGLTVNILFLDEFALVQPHQAETFMMSAFPTVSASEESKIIICSTPRGKNHFYTLYEGDNNFAPFTIEWDEPPGRDEEFKAEIIASQGELFWNQEFAAQFEGSSNTLIDSKCLKTIKSKMPLEVKFEGALRIYEHFEEGHSYGIGVDVAEGYGGDDSAFTIVDYSVSPYRQVAAYSNNDIKTAPFAALLHNMGLLYNNATIVIENNGPGLEVATILYDEYEYDNVLRWDRLKKHKAEKPGLNMTKHTKLDGCLSFKDYMESYKYEVFDLQTLNQLWNYISDKGTWKGDSGKKDDLVACHVILFYFMKLPIFSDFIKNPQDFLTDIMGEEISRIDAEIADLFSVDGNFGYGENEVINETITISATSYTEKYYEDSTTLDSEIYELIVNKYKEDNRAKEVHWLFS